MIFLPKGPTMSEEDAIRWLTDEAFKASKQMIRTHHKEDIVRFIILAQTLELHGYHMIWVKFKGCVGATKAVQGATPTISTCTIINATKEVMHYAESGNHGEVNVVAGENG
jgi:hypothetical protein